jgi:ClpP class serine protease
MNENAPVLHRLATRIFNTPLMIHPAKLDTILAVLGSRVGIEAPVVPMLGPAEPEKSMAVKLEAVANRNGSSHRFTLGVVPVRGTLVHRTSGLGAMSGLRSYEMIRKDFRAARADAETDAIVMDFTTYGGEVHGCFDLVDEIFQARGDKKIIGIANEYAYSAG